MTEMVSSAAALFGHKNRSKVFHPFFSFYKGISILKNTNVVIKEVNEEEFSFVFCEKMYANVDPSDNLYDCMTNGVHAPHFIGSVSCSGGLSGVQWYWP